MVSVGIHTSSLNEPYLRMQTTSGSMSFPRSLHFFIPGRCETHLSLRWSDQYDQPFPFDP